jgi:hypothetical protein
MPKPLAWIPPTEGEDFPYADAKFLLESVEGMEFRPKDFASLIAAGERIGWGEEVIAEHRAMGERGLCLDFLQSEEPRLRGTLFETSVFFQFDDEAHLQGCTAFIERGARRIGVRILQRSR